MKFRDEFLTSPNFRDDLQPVQTPPSPHPKSKHDPLVMFLIIGMDSTLKAEQILTDEFLLDLKIEDGRSIH